MICIFTAIQIKIIVGYVVKINMMILILYGKTNVSRLAETILKMNIIANFMLSNFKNYFKVLKPTQLRLVRVGVIDSQTN